MLAALPNMTEAATAPPRFITLEGIEGVGKTTHIEAIRDLLQSRGGQVLATREPGGTELGEALRQVLLHGPAMGAEAELLLMFAARVQHVRQVIQPALERGDWLLCDRFVDASYAYQGAGRGIPMQRIEALQHWALPGFAPGLTLVLDAPVTVGLQRAAQRRGPVDRFEREPQDFFERIRLAYLQRAELRPRQYRIIDAAAPLPQVRQAVLAAVEQFLVVSKTG